MLKMLTGVARAVLALGAAGSLLHMAMDLRVCAAAGEREERPPNFVVILVDDLGWKDLGCTGSRFYETPNIDRLAGDGMKFGQAYSACTVCSPTRAALLTGKYPARLKLTDWIPGHRNLIGAVREPDWKQRLGHEEQTIAERLKKKGYKTAAIGKWHLGGAEHGPETQGFDLNRGGDHRGQPPSYFAPYKIPSMPDGPGGEFLTDRESIEAVKFIEANQARPFFLYLAHYAVHTPIQAKTNATERYAAKAAGFEETRNPTYAALVESVDESVGRIVGVLDRLNLTGKTVIFFTSDNGGLLPVTLNHPLRAGKGSAYEGGVRVPLIVKWPEKVAARSESSVPVSSVDIAPTILQIAGIERGEGDIMDGRSLVPLLLGEAGFSREALFWHYPHYHPGGATPYGAIRAGDFKLIEFYEENNIELYNLKADPSERLNVANQMPALANELKGKLEAWRREVGAQMPLSNAGLVDPMPALLKPHVIKPGPDGILTLHARDVTVHGATVRYEPQPHKNTIGYWTKVEDWVSWEVYIPWPGSYRVVIFQGCGPGSGGSEVEFDLAGQVLPVVVKETRGFQDFIEREIGTVEIQAAGRYRLKVVPKKKPGVAVMDLRWVKLVR